MSNDFREQIYRNFNQKSTKDLIEIWITNDHAMWSALSFDVIQEILIERQIVLPTQNEPITEDSINRDKKEKPIENTIRPKFNLKLPIYGAIAFGIGFALLGAIMITIYNVASNSLTLNHTNKYIFTNASIGIFGGGIGGAGLGLALKDKTRILFFILAGAIGFGIAFSMVIAIDSSLISEIDWAIIGFIRGSLGVFSYEYELVRGFGLGAIIGAIGGSVLGLGAPKNRVISSLLLFITGIISFGTIFNIGMRINDGNFYSWWNAVGGGLGGAGLGTALALYYIIAERIHQKKDLRL